MVQMIDRLIKGAGDGMWYGFTLSTTNKITTAPGPIGLWIEPKWYVVGVDDDGVESCFGGLGQSGRMFFIDDNIVEEVSLGEKYSEGYK